MADISKTLQLTSKHIFDLWAAIASIKRPFEDLLPIENFYETVLLGEGKNRSWW